MTPMVAASANLPSFSYYPAFRADPNSATQHINECADFFHG